MVIGVFLALAAPARAALTVGIGDQQPAAYADARLRALKVPTARMIVPWDAATSQPEKVAAWLAAVQAAGMAPHVAFAWSKGRLILRLKCAVTPCWGRSPTACAAPPGRSSSSARAATRPRR